MSDDQTPLPFYLEHRPKGRLMHTADVADVIAQPGQNRTELAKKVRGLVNRGYLFPVARDISDARGALLFSPASALTAAALLAATDSGLQGVEKLMQLALALQTWSHPVDKGSPVNPAAFIILEHGRAPDTVQGWSLELHTTRAAGAEDTRSVAVIRHGDNGFLGADVELCREGHAPVASLIIPLEAFLPGIMANLAKRKLN